jgi:hypothetical protein
MSSRSNTKAEIKNKVLFDTLQATFGQSMHLSRIKFFGLFICALCKVQTVGFERLATAFDNQANVPSSLRRIQRFMASYALETDLIARLVFMLLPKQTSYRLVIDRTNWKFGSANINILLLAVVYKGVAFPLLFTMLPKFGNSCTQERIELMERYIRLFGLESIDCLLADREFIGQHWINYLNRMSIRYHIRIKENFWVTIPKNGQKVKVSWLFNHLRLNSWDLYQGIVNIKGQLCYLSASKVLDKNGSPEFQIIISFNKPEQAIERYKERWQIESAFRALKTSGFNIEDTHLTDIKRIEKLLALVLVAFAWAYVVGIFLDQIKPIKRKKHGRRAKSIFKYGLEYISKVLLSNNDKEFQRICLFLSCT